MTRTWFEDNTIKPDHELPVCDLDRARIHTLLPPIIAACDAPEIVAATVLGAAAEIAPKLRYTAGKQAGQVRFLWRFLPESLVDKVIRRFNQLPA
ncbi:Rossmann-fold NAD(P)-binding domain-containing protein [Ralstonia mojiangensis]|uniref:hypothetical protein n=1 Tax=Ralstonia mojiangensis TaxID=2953895 RepID=UPI0021B1C014|nr:hypothetical protein [Ralstonia mojiangensis]MCT7328737.1 hypothetical protein [Ralstonia mojiangensis]